MMKGSSKRHNKRHDRRHPSKLFLVVIIMCLVFYGCVWSMELMLDEAQGTTLWDDLNRMKQEPNEDHAALKQTMKPKLSLEKLARAEAVHKSSQLVKEAAKMHDISPKLGNQVAPKIKVGNMSAENVTPPLNHVAPRQELAFQQVSNRPVAALQEKASDRTRYIVFLKLGMGQGAGNIVNGLLAAHLLAEEFDRVVCVDSSFNDFTAAFQPLDPRAVEGCPTVKTPSMGGRAAITLVNFMDAPDECSLKERLASDEEVIAIVANTYPRWRPVPDGFFKKYYKPGPALHAIIPKELPKTVVHLRRGDSGMDKRAGLDDVTLEALGKSLPSDTYLVTNNVAWYDYFAEHFHWKHPEWRGVQHSASHAFMWGQEQALNLTDKERTNELQNLEMWSDWYCMLSADRVWHTHSDFSLSAIHWMNVDSKTIMGVDGTGNLKLKDEAWRTDQVMLPVKDRGPNELKNCREALKPADATKRRGEPKSQTEEREKSPQPIETRKKEIVLVQEQEKISQPGDGQKDVAPVSNHTRYILFQKFIGQGNGNIVAGLLAAHMLAEEFDRVVCVESSFKDFNDAFQPIDPRAVSGCPALKPVGSISNQVISIVNFLNPPDECSLKERLGSDEEVIVMMGNTYPRWRPVTKGFFKLYYKPTAALQAMLPWNEPPKTVVHLRKADNSGDRRVGLDNATLEALGKALPSDTYLVTNNVEWYNYFAQHFHWKHPEWRAVEHSALGFQWGRGHSLSEEELSHHVQNLQSWSDWYAMIGAELVWHTHSDFSLSAIHWMNVDSKTIMGVDDMGNLKLRDEAWRTDPIMLPVKDRGPGELKNCRRSANS